MEGGKWGQMGTERVFAWSDDGMMQCADDVVLSCTLQLCIGFEPMSLQ